MMNAGIIEGFFGPKWNDQRRLSFAPFLKKYGGTFYIYAPKQDPFLRKKWREEWPLDYCEFLKSLSTHFSSFGIKFGVGFSPFELGTQLTATDRAHLEKKLSILSNLGVEMLGLFFDDMPTTDGLAKAQIETVQVVEKNFSGKIIFCPSYYTPDPILDKVFGQRPPDYLEEIAEGIPSQISIAWTGPKVISMEIPESHLLETATLLKRAPFLWENLYANDGPRNCKFLKLRYFSGRTPTVLKLAEAYGFNMMNQPELSKIVYLSSLYVSEGKTEGEAFVAATRELCSSGFADFILKNRLIFLEKGLDQISSDEKNLLLQKLSHYPDVAAKEIFDWLEGKYNVGSECLTD